MIKLDHIVLQVTDFSTALQFYRKLFEFMELTEVPDPGFSDSVGFRQKDGLTIWVNKSEIRSIKPKAGTLDHFAFYCENREEVDQAFQFCKEQGWEALGSPKTYSQYGNFYGFAFEGPDGQKLEFVTR